ncbi:MAG: hypothetical protein MJ179_06065 [Treponema sp.]|nr:hypothetical protein [Treponema sp.]
MENMTQQDFLQKIQTNKLYQKSKALHKDYQFNQFSQDGNFLNGQIIRKEDPDGNIIGDPNYNDEKGFLVIYFFKNGVLTDDDKTPAIQAPGHWEHWKNGMITSIFANGGRVLETWKDGVPVKIEEKEEM